MLNTKLFDEISARIAQLAESSPAAEFEKNSRALLTSLFSRLDLVTREEFDIQRELLDKTREKLEALEKKVAELESKQ